MVLQRSFTTPIYKKDKIKEQYNELKITFKSKYGIVFRAYNDGVAYRVFSGMKNDLTIKNEIAEFNFAGNYKCWIPYVKSRPNNKFQSAFQNTYEYKAISEFETDKIAFLPLLADLGNGLKVCITESDLEDYPGMYLHNPEKKNGYNALFPPYPKTEKQTLPRQQRVIDQSEDYIAKTKGSRNFPWRIIMVSENDSRLIENDMVYCLGEESRIKDVSWIKPGKSAWDWWSNWSMAGVDFKAGINNETYKHYIDFAAENKLEYIILDEGWSNPAEGNILKVVKDIDLKELVEYGRQKNVGIFIWTVWNVLDDKLEEACKTYSEMGIKGFKIDFFDRDDQKLVNTVYRIATVCAKYHLLLDLHGFYKPTGLNRTFPNILNFEGVFGMEELKWSNPDMPGYDVTFPFVRMLAGPCDYTSGAMKNANKKNFAIIFNEPMSQGTRCHQLATYILFDSYFTMLCDSPSNYKKDLECTQFISSVPVVWNETKVLDAKVGDYLVVARRSGDNWFVGGMTNWEPREFDLDFSFLPNGTYRAEIFEDGLNANEVAIDFKKTLRTFNNQAQLKVKLASGGGFAIRLMKQ